MTKKEYILQYVAIGVSILAVIVSVFTGWMTTEISGKLTKQNELETRNYEQKNKIYEDIRLAVNIIENGTGTIGEYKEIYKQKVLKYQSDLEIYGSTNINSLTQCINNGFKFIGIKENISDNELDKIKTTDKRIRDQYKFDISIPLILLKREIRNEINSYESNIDKFSNDSLAKILSGVSEEKIIDKINTCYKGGKDKLLIIDRTSTGIILHWYK